MHFTRNSRKPDTLVPILQVAAGGEHEESNIEQFCCMVESRMNGVDAWLQQKGVAATFKAWSVRVTRDFPTPCNFDYLESDPQEGHGVKTKRRVLLAATRSPPVVRAGRNRHFRAAFCACSAR